MNCPVCLHHLTEGISLDYDQSVYKYPGERIFYCERCKQVFLEEDFLFNTEDPC